MSVRPSDISAIFSEDTPTGKFIPVVTFGFLYTVNQSVILFVLFLYSILVGTHRSLIKHRSDTPDRYSTLGKVISGGPLFLLYPIGLGVLFVNMYQNFGSESSQILISIKLLLTFLNMSYIFGMIYIEVVDKD